MVHINNKKTSKKIKLIALVLLIGAGGYGIWHHVHYNSKPATVAVNNGRIATADPNVPGSEAKDNNPTSNSVPPSKDNASNQTATADPSVQPASPINSTFVSYHTPTRSGSPGPGEVSTCVTTPGVMCQIKFVSGSTVKYLPAQRTDASGSTSWSWNINSGVPNLSTGKWTVSAVATNGDKSASAPDATQLVVPQ